MVKDKKEGKKFKITNPVKIKEILKKSQMTVSIPQREQEPYKPIYFKQEMEDAQKSMFFS